jgi:predicted metal-dependent hydrolase
LFECHETLEELWLAETDELRYLYQGILQVGVGYLHLQRGNHHGAVTKLHSGCALLEYFVPNCLGIEVQALMDAANRDLKRLQSLGVERLEEFDLATIPTIGMTPRVGEAA